MSIAALSSLDLVAQQSCADLFKPVEPAKTVTQLLFEKVKIAEDDDISKIEADFVSRGGFKNESWIENELNFARFIRKATLLQNKNEHPTEIYGEENYKAFRTADEYLKSIPTGEFKLNDEVLQNTHRKAAEGVVSVLRKFHLNDLIPPGYLPTEAGAFKKRTSFGRDPLFYPISDKDVEALRSNPWLGDLGGQHGFYELPFLSKPNARRGFIVYANPKNLKSNLEKLYSETEEKIKLTKEKKYSASLLAAEVQLALVSLHPFVDGNGRTSRLIMDRVLKEVGLPPTLLEDTSNDLYMTPKEWASEIQKGLRTYVEIMTRVSNFQAPRIGNGVSPILNLELLNQVLQKNIQVKGINFQFQRDGFLYNQKGIPHIYKNGILYPISDKTYILYQMSNKNKITSTSYVEIFNSNIDLANKVLQEPQSASAVKVIDYSHLISANKKGDAFLYDWQKPLIKELLDIQETDPVKVLTIFGRKQSDFETTANPNNLSLVLAQYEKIDHQLWSLKQQLKS